MRADCCRHRARPSAPEKKKGVAFATPFFLVGGLGFEPRLTESESVVLPLDDPPRHWQNWPAAILRISSFTLAGSEFLPATKRSARWCARRTQISAWSTDGPRRAFRRPTFLRSTSRASRVTKPALRSVGRRRFVVFHQRAGDAVADRAGLAGDATACDLHGEVEAAFDLCNLQRLAHDHAAGFAAEELVERTVIDRDACRCRPSCIPGPLRSCADRCRTVSLPCVTRS